MNYFIADLHLGHKNTLAFDHRPFKTIRDHDDTIIKNWNEEVNIDDDVYILGDISWHNVMLTIGIVELLNGNKHLIVGNHDKRFLKNRDFRNLFVEICDCKELDLGNGKSIVLCYYPIPCFKNHFYGWYHLYGHVHNSFEHNMMLHCKWQMEELYDKPCDMHNVGCMIDYMNYKPRTLEYILEHDLL